VHVDASGAESKPSTGNMYVIAEHGHTSRYTQETHYDDAVISEFETGKTSRQHRRLPETKEDNEQSSVMKDDTQSSMYGDTGLRHRKKKEDRSLKTEESKTKGYMRLETDTGQTVYTQREPKRVRPRICDMKLSRVRLHVP